MMLDSSKISASRPSRPTASRSVSSDNVAFGGMEMLVAPDAFRIHMPLTLPRRIPQISKREFIERQLPVADRKNASNEELLRRYMNVKLFYKIGLHFITNAAFVAGGLASGAVVQTMAVKTMLEPVIRRSINYLESGVLTPVTSDTALGRSIDSTIEWCRKKLAPVPRPHAMSVRFASHWANPRPDHSVEKMIGIVQQGVEALASDLSRAGTSDARKNEAFANFGYHLFDKLAGTVKGSLPPEQAAELAELGRIIHEAGTLATGMTDAEYAGGFASQPRAKKQRMLGLCYDALQSPNGELKQWGAELARHLGIAEQDIARVSRR